MPSSWLPVPRPRQLPSHHPDAPHRAPASLRPLPSQFLLIFAIFLCCVGGKALLAAMTLHDSVEPDIETTIGAGGEHLDKWGDCVWWAWSLFLDPAAMPDAHGFSVRVVAAVQAIIGVTYFAVFLALVVDKVQEVCAGGRRAGWGSAHRWLC